MVVVIQLLNGLASSAQKMYQKMMQLKLYKVSIRQGLIIWRRSLAADTTARTMSNARNDYGMQEVEQSRAHLPRTSEAIQWSHPEPDHAVGITRRLERWRPESPQNMNYFFNKIG